MILYIEQNVRVKFNISVPFLKLSSASREVRNCTNACLVAVWIERLCYMNVASSDRCDSLCDQARRLSAGKMLLPEFNFRVDEYHMVGTTQNQ